MKKLLEQRAALVAKMRAITTASAGANGDLSAEQSAQFDTHKTELDRIEAQITRQQVLDDAERRMAGTPIAGSGDGRLDEELRNFSLRNVLAGAAGMAVEWGRERELSAEVAKRAGRPFQGVAVPLSVLRRPVEQRDLLSTGSSGNLIATDYKGDQFIDMLRAALVIRKLGARVLSGLVGTVDIPKQSGASTAGWVAEDSGLSFSDPTFAKVSMSPKHAGMLTEFSRNMLLQSSPDIEQLIRADMAAVLARAVDAVAINGGGANEPTGVLQTAGLDVTVSNAITWAKVLQLIEIVQLENSEGSAWLTDASVVRKLRSTAKVTSTDSVMIMQEPGMLAGYPAATSNTVPAADATHHKLIFGAWSDVLLGYWSELDILVNPYESAAYAKGNVQVRGMLTCDVAIRHIESFAASADVAI